MYDVIIRNGEVIDGTGKARYAADVAIKDGRIVKIGRIEGDAATIIDAKGKIVCPGFIDVHTHFDAQVFWDNAMTPSPLHGVTTAFAGNCGFTIAPLSSDPSDGDYLMRMLARVEGMPLGALQTGVPWNWTTTAEYFDRIEERGLGINLGLSVGHSAIRRVAMGREANQRAATADEIEKMKRLLRDGLAAGGLGFTSSYARTHNDSDGAMVPSRHATTAELVELASVCGEFEGTSLEVIPQVGPRFDQWALDLMADMSVAAQRPLNWNVMTVNQANLEDCLVKLEAGDYAAKKGGRVVALTMPISFGTRMSFASGFVLDAMPDWEGVMLAPLDKKIKVFRDKAARDALNEKAQRPDNPMRGVANWDTKVIYDVLAPENEPYKGRVVGEIARELGKSSWDTICDIALADDLNTSFGTPVPPELLPDWKARAQVWRDRRAVIGASDAGAHFDLLASFNYATGMLGRGVRGHDIMPLEEAIHLITDVQAQLYGLRQRGQVQEGWCADLVVLDPATIDSDPIAMRHDLPGGSPRLYAESRGIDHVLVNGRAIVAGGKLTAERSGTLLRSGRDTATASLA